MLIVWLAMYTAYYIFTLHSVYEIHIIKTGFLIEKSGFAVEEFTYGYTAIKSKAIL